MACRLFGIKPLPKPMLLYCQLECCLIVSWTLRNLFQWNSIWNLNIFNSRKCMKFYLKFKHFQLKKMYLNLYSAKCQLSWSDLNVLVNFPDHTVIPFLISHWHPENNVSSRRPIPSPISRTSNQQQFCQPSRQTGKSVTVMNHLRSHPSHRIGDHRCWIERKSCLLYSEYHIDGIVEEWHN